jgi:hypothetical protein
MLNRMKSPKNILRARRYTTRINVAFAIMFLLTITSLYGDYLVKLKTHPNLPLVAMFFKVTPSTWDQATPFNK